MSAPEFLELVELVSCEATSNCCLAAGLSEAVKMASDPRYELAVVLEYPDVANQEARRRFLRARLKVWF